MLAVLIVYDRSSFRYIYIIIYAVENVVNIIANVMYCRKITSVLI